MSDGLRYKALALLAVAALHVGFYHLLSLDLASSATTRSAASVMRVEFIERVRRPVAPLPVREPSAQPRRPRPAVATAAAPEQASPSPQAATPAPADPLVLEWADADDAEPGFRMNLPDGRLPELLAMEEPDSIRMRRQVSGKDVVEGAAQLLGLWPEGYAADSCPRIKRSVAGLMTDGSAAGRALLAEELRRQRAKCRE